MKDFFKGKFATGLVVIATVILAGVAIFTALRLYQLRTQSVSPTAPERPRASGGEDEGEKIACTNLAFSITIPSSTPTPTGELSPTPTPTLTGVPTSTPTATSTQQPSATSQPTSTPTPSGTTLPDAGISAPTIFGVSLGVLILAAAVLLAF